MFRPDDLPDDPEQGQCGFIYVGRVCPACGGDAECPVCDGSGETGELVTFEAFRVMASLAGPPEPRLV